VIFLGVGFETTAPAIACSILTAITKRVENYFVLSAHKTMPSPMRVLSADPELAIDGYLSPPHVSAVIGADSYRFLAKEFGLPCVVTGFEPADILQGVIMLARQALAGESSVEIQYSRVVDWEGNRRAREVMEQVFSPCDAQWRGIGVIPGSGLAINADYGAFDATQALPVEVEPPMEPAGCCCGEVLKGKLSPFDCPLFDRGCTPEAPVGACMVSSEGTCAAAYRYGR
jgi:hydrogenase expression/formation protein HypD